MLPTTQSSGLLNRRRQRKLSKTINISSPTTNTFLFNRPSSARTTSNTANSDQLSLIPMRSSSARFINNQNIIKYDLDNDEKNDINPTTIPLFNSTTNDQHTNDNSLTFIHYYTTDKNEKIANSSSSSDTNSTSVSTSLSASSNWSSTSNLTKNTNNYKSENIKEEKQGLFNPDQSIMDSLHDTSPIELQDLESNQFPDIIIKSRQSQDSGFIFVHFKQLN